MLLGTQTLFNIGFYAVVPFLAVVLAQDFGLAATAIGLVLGIRTFAQQGLFLLGGALADRFGARTIILSGIATRVAGFALLAASLAPERAMLALFVLGTVLTGLGGALFSPGLNTLIAEAERRRPGARTTLFAWLSVTGEIGAVLGPLLGAVLLDFGFAAVAASGAAFFTAIGLLLGWLLPRSPERPRARQSPQRGTLPKALRDRAFFAFAALHAVDLLAYNQLYLAVPLMLARVEAPARTVALVFAWVSILTLTAQLPLARWSRRLGAPAALRIAYLASTAGFAMLAVTTLVPGPNREPVVFSVATCFTLGHLLANPTALSLVPRFAGDGATGSYFGLLATLGGLAVLVGGLSTGIMLDAVPARWEVLPWLALAIPPLISALTVPRVLRAGPHRPSAAATFRASAELPGQHRTAEQR
ncbi:MAG: MFS transporter [Leucobacter sp.]